MRADTKGQRSKGMKKSSALCAPVPLLISAILFMSCVDKPSIPEKDFIEIYVQLQMIDAQCGDQPAVQKMKVDSLLKAFKVSDSVVLSALSWYRRKPERWHVFFAEVQNKMNSVKAAYLRGKH